MDTRIQIVAHEEIDKGLLNQIRTWSNEVLEKLGALVLPPHLCITIWKSTVELEEFYRREKESLGVPTAEETDYLATHEAWRGYPRIHICQEKLKGIAEAVVQGVVHHELGHALHHGSPKFYTFRFSQGLQEVGRLSGMDLPLLQHYVYFLSVAIKDWEVVQWLSEIGLASSQWALLEHLISHTEEEQRIWEAVRESPAPRKIALAAFLKTALPIEAIISVGIKGAQGLKNQWNEAYGWLSESERESLFQLSDYAITFREKTFQERLEQIALRLLTDPSM